MARLKSRKICLIVADDPVARTKLRRIFDGLGFDTPEAASVKMAQKCLDPMPTVVVVVENPGRESLFDIFGHLPGMHEPDSPKRLALQVPGSAGGNQKAHITGRLQDVEEDYIRVTLGTLNID